MWIFYYPLDGMLVHHRVSPGIKCVGNHLYTWLDRGTACESKASCSLEHNTMSPAGLKAGRSGVEQTTCNREITASSHMVAIATTYIETSKSWWGKGKFQGNNPFFNNVITIHGLSKELIQVTRVYSLGNWKTLLVITPNSNTFSDWKKTCTCRGSKHTNSRGKQQLELSTRTWAGRAP